VLTRSHYDLTFTGLACRNVASYSPPTLPAEQGARPQSETLMELAAIVLGNGMTADAVDDFAAEALARRLVDDPQSRVQGRDPQELLDAAAPLRLEDRMLDMMLRAGPYGDGLGSNPGGLSLQVLQEHPHGIDLGPLEPRLPEVLRTPSGKVELAPQQVLDDLPRLVEALHRPPGGLLLVGRRDLRSNNSWMHNLEPMVKGRNRCTLHVHPSDAEALGLAPGGSARVTSAAGEVEIEVEVTEAIRPGVVSIPHGWGHDQPDTRTTTATAHAGVNSNILTDELVLDPLTGTVALNGIPVAVVPA
jgi:anaerobic selenocysteine-containing dehydrogenase